MSKPKISKVYYSLTHWLDFRLKLFGEGIVIGLFVGLIIVAFRYLIEQADMLRNVVYSYLRAEEWPFTYCYLLLLIY